MAPQLRMARGDVASKLHQAVARGEDLIQLPATTNADRATLLAGFRTWDEFNRRLLESAFTHVPWHEASPRSEYGTVVDLQYNYMQDLTEEEGGAFVANIKEKIRRLQSILESLDLYAGDASNPISGAPEDSHVDGESAQRAIFLVHGRDVVALLEVQRLLERVTDLPVIALEQQPSRGQTIIEKIGTYFNDSAFAVVIMTADDEGRLRADAGELKLRARQNVVFELGYAVARLGRENVAVLYEDGVELPSDYYGVVYTRFDQSGGWKLTLAGELRAAGISVDANKAMD